MTILASTDRAYDKALRKIVTRARTQGAGVEKSVRTILKAVERGGDRAVLRYTKKFDRLSLKLDHMRVTPEEIKEAYYHIRKDEGDSLRYAAERVRQFHERQRTKTWMYQEQTPRSVKWSRPWTLSVCTCRAARPSIPHRC